MDLMKALFGSSLPSASPAEVNEKMKNGKRPLLVDVRQPEEYRRGHIDGAKLIPLGELHGRMKELPKNKEIVLVCATGNRSRSATKMLVREGYDAVNMNGGMMSWARNGLSVKK